MMAARDGAVNRNSYTQKFLHRNSRTEDKSLRFRFFSRMADFGQKRRHQALRIVFLPDEQTLTNAYYSIAEFIRERR